MNLSLSTQWGPYRDVAEAHACLCRFVDRVCAPDVGVVWAAQGGVFPLRAPRRGGSGFGDVLIFEWTPLPPPTPRPASGFWPKLRAFIKTCLEQEGQAAIAQGQAEMAMGKAVDGAIGRMFTSHRDDGVGVALDILCIALSIALIPTGLGVVGAIGLLGGSILLASDGAAYAMELDGKDERAQAIKKQTETIRIIATVMTLPDVAYGGFKAVRELREINALRALDRTTATTAEALGARTQTAARADRYNQIAERANLRAQIRTQQISAAVAHEITPRASGVGSTILLLKEEFASDDSALHQFLSRLRIHSTTVHK